MDREEADVPTRDRSERIRRIVAECVERYAQEGEAAVELLCAAHPDEAEAVRERISKLGRAGLLDMPTSPRDQLPDRLGEFRLIRRLGIGGMGVVYLAEQESLGRQVALKLVRPELLYFPGARERFRREIESIARLADPGIVPIHAVGEDAGIPYFAMAYVEGATLASALTALAGRDAATLQGRDLAIALAEASGVRVPEPLPEAFRGSWSSTCSKLVRQMALALHHAHERGVVHRDVKPSNAICTPTGDVLMLDFGLAAAEGSARVTKTGAQLGTPYCMAPEQLLDLDVDARTDVYALGVTLYELLTLRAPYDSPSSERLRADIIAGVLRAPSKINRDVPRDLDIVCLEAMDRDPARRYPSALALAQDLELFLGHRPIIARPSGTWLRTRRWARRHPGLATAAVVTPLLLAGAYSYVDARRDSDRLEHEVRTSLSRALEAIDRLVDQARDGTLENTPGLDLVRSAQLDSALDLLRTLHRDNPGRDELTIALARGLDDAAMLRETLGRYDLSQAATDEAVAVLGAVHEGSANWKDRELLEASLLISRGHCLLAKGEHDAAESCWRTAVTAFERIEARPPTPGFVYRHHATGLTNLAMMMRTRREFAAAERLIRQAIELDSRVNDTRPDAVTTTLRMRTDLAVVTSQLGKYDDARALFTAIAADAEKLVAQYPKDPELLRESARAALNVGRAHLIAKEADKALELIEVAASRFEQLAHDFPDRVTYAWERDLTGLEVARAAISARQYDKALTWYRTTISSHEALARRLPDRLEYVNELSEMRRSLAGLLAERGETAAAQALLDSAFEAQSALITARPDDPIWSRQLAFILAQRGMLCARDDPAGARRALEAAAERFEALRAGPFGEPTDSRFLADCLFRAADACSHLHDQDAAMVAVVRGQAVQPLGPAELEQLGRELDLTERAEFRGLLDAAKKQ